MARLGTLIGAGLASLIGLAGCGAYDDTERKPPRAVKLQVSSPVDAALIRGSTLEVRGSVSPPGAQVRVQGRRARVSGGTFTSVVSLARGANVVDVAATARNRSAALTAFRVTREVRVAVPDLAGEAADDAERQIARLGLRFESVRGGGLLDPLVPSRLAVCEQEPAVGARARRGATVRVIVARSC